MKACGCNIFAGGFTIGVKRHFDVVAHLEHDSYGSEPMRLNLPRVQLFVGDGVPVESEAKAAVFEAGKGWPTTSWFENNNIKFIFANPPCAPFSVAAGARQAHTSWDRDPRIKRTHDVVALLEHANPVILATESVTAGWTKGRPMWLAKAKEAAQLGYALTVVLHDAVNLGVPQRRSRVFFVFHKVALELPEPEWRPITVREAWRGLRVTAAERRRYGETHKAHKHSRFVAKAKPGERLAHVYNRMYGEKGAGRNERGDMKGRPGFLVSRLPLDKPSTVVLGGDVMFHPTETRLVLPSEVARLATFPDDWEWPDDVSLATITGWMSRGIAPKVGEWLAKGVKKSIERNKKIKPFVAVRDLRKAPGTYEVIS